MIPRLKADLRLSDLAALWPSGNSARDVERFERAFAALAGQKHAIAFPYGRTSQIAILNALGKPGAEVICPSYTCVVVPHAIVKAGMKPVFVDSNEDDFNMDWDFVREASSPDTAAVIATSIFGHPVNGEAFQAYREDYPDTIILQDCAHSFLANDTHREGLAAFYGLNVSKIITSVFGGMVTTDDDSFAAKICAVREQTLKSGGIAHEIRRSLYLTAVMIAFTRPVYGVVNLMERQHLLDRFVKYYDPSVIDLPKDAFVAMGGLESRIGLRQCERYHSIIEHRRYLAKIYHEKLSGVGDLLLPPRHEGMTVSHFVVRTSHAAQIKSACLDKGIQLGELIDYDCSDMPTYQEAKYYGLRRSRGFPEIVVNLPVHIGVSDDDALRICEIIRDASSQITKQANAAPHNVARLH